MAKKSETSLLDETETLVRSLVREANAAADTDDAKGPDFSERLKVVQAVTGFLTVRNKLAPPDKDKSVFEDMKDDFYGGTTGRDAPAPANRSRKKRSGGDEALADFDDAL